MTPTIAEVKQALTGLQYRAIPIEDLELVTEEPETVAATPEGRTAVARLRRLRAGG